MYKVGSKRFSITHFCGNFFVLGYVCDALEHTFLSEYPVLSAKYEPKANKFLRMKTCAVYILSVVVSSKGKGHHLRWCEKVFIIWRTIIRDFRKNNKVKNIPPSPERHY